jgi:hypothetical protein
VAQFSGSFRWTIRLLVWGIGIAVMIPAYNIGRSFGTVSVMQECAEKDSKAAKVNGLFGAQEFALCMFLKSNYLESRRQEPALRAVMALREAPCDRVGIWKSARERSVYRVTLNDDNRFTAESVSEFSPREFTGPISGYWGEAGTRMVWLYDEGVVWPPDINRLEAESQDRFALIEVNGERTEFTLERKLESKRCPRT